MFWETYATITLILIGVAIGLLFGYKGDERG